LGGFVHTKQLLEVWGINDSFYQIIAPQVTVDLSKVQKVNVNTATADVLKQHPYIWRWSLAKAIVNYREQHGKYRRAEDLKPIVLMHDSILQRLEPYLNFD
jgi:competence ComEA-like helix-hairpin-helix protein